MYMKWIDFVSIEKCKMQKYIGLKKKSKNFYFIVVKDDESDYVEKIGFFSTCRVKDKMFAIDSYRLVYW